MRWTQNEQMIPNCQIQDPLWKIDRLYFNCINYFKAHRLFKYVGLQQLEIPNIWKDHRPLYTKEKNKTILAYLIVYSMTTTFVQHPRNVPRIANGTFIVCFVIFSDNGNWIKLFRSYKRFNLHRIQTVVQSYFKVTSNLEFREAILLLQRTKSCSF